jgi:hypothetical protein
VYGVRPVGYPSVVKLNPMDTSEVGDGLETKIKGERLEGYLVFELSVSELSF